MLKKEKKKRRTNTRFIHVYRFGYNQVACTFLVHSSRSMRDVTVSEVTVTNWTRMFSRGMGMGMFVTLIKQRPKIT